MAAVLTETGFVPRKVTIDVETGAVEVLQQNTITSREGGVDTVRSSTKFRKVADADQDDKLDALLDGLPAVRIAAIKGFRSAAMKTAAAERRNPSGEE